MNHGTATLKKSLINDVGEVIRKKGESGIITAFLPEDDRYAVMFDGQMGVNNWFTFNKKSFEEHFNYEIYVLEIK